MKPLKIMTALLLVIAISGCNSDSLDISEASKKPQPKIEQSQNEDKELESCETAFAKFHNVCVYDGYVFSDKNNSNPDNYKSLGISNRWGWATNIDVSWGKETFELWAGAGKNDISKGVLVGEVSVMRRKSTKQVIVTYVIKEGYAMSEIHIYANDFKPETAAPGQFGYTKEFSTPTNYYKKEFTVDDTDGDGVWVIAHAVVCPS